MSTDHNKFASLSLVDRVRTIENCIEEATDSDLYNFFVEIVKEIFGHGQDKGWELDKLKTRVCTFYKFTIIFLVQSEYLG